MQVLRVTRDDGPAIGAFDPDAGPPSPASATAGLRERRGA